MGKMNERDILSEIAVVLGVDEETLILKLLTINALLLEKAKREGVEPKEFFEGCLYVPASVREKLGEYWEEDFKQFLKEIEGAGIEKPLEEAAYWIRKLTTQKRQDGLREMTIFVDEKLFDEFVKTADKALELGLVKENYIQEMGKQIANLVKGVFQKEVKMLKDKMLRMKIRGK